MRVGTGVRRHDEAVGLRRGQEVALLPDQPFRARLEGLLRRELQSVVRQVQVVVGIPRRRAVRVGRAAGRGGAPLAARRLGGACGRRVGLVPGRATGQHPRPWTRRGTTASAGL